MTISDAQFSAWLARDEPRCVLCELKFAYESGGDVAEGTIYLSNRPYGTEASETPASTRYRAVIERLPRIKRSVLSLSRGGRSELSVSDMELVNVDGELDDLLLAVIDGREAVFYLGSPSWARSDFRQVVVAVAERVIAPDERKLVVKMRDKRLLLDREVMGSQVGGSDAEAARYLPLLWGSHFNVEALIYDAANLSYAVLSSPYSAAVAYDVRDSGLSLVDTPVTVQALGATSITVDAGTETFGKVGHALAVNDVVRFTQSIASSEYSAFAPFAGMTSGQQYWVASVPSADTFTLAETKGGAAINVTGTTYLGNTAGTTIGRMEVRRYYDDLVNTGRIQLSSTPAGRVTVDLTANVSYATTPYAFAKYLIETYGNVESSEIDSAAFTAADTAVDAKVGLGYMSYHVRERENLVDVLDALLGSVFGWWGQDSAGKITCGLLDVSGIASATATRTLTAAMVHEPGLSVVPRAPGYGRVNVDYGRNYTVQADGLAATVDPENMRLYAAPFTGALRSTAPSGTTYAGNKPLYHKTMAEEGPRAEVDISTTRYGLDTALPIGDYADEIVADQAPFVQEIGATVGLEAYEWDLGEVVEITYPRFGLAAGVNARIVEVEVDLDAEAVAVVMLRQATPDTTTSAYP
jgi:hypothetical protein